MKVITFIITFLKNYGLTMIKSFKFLVSIFASVVLLVLIAVIAIPLLIDPNDFKPQIEAAVKQSTGRDLGIEGDLELSIFPWVGISTGKLVLSNAKGFTDKPFAEITASHVKVKVIPLFSKEVKVSRIVLKGLVLNLAKNAAGLNNWDDLRPTANTAESIPLANQGQHVNKAVKIMKESGSGAATPLAALAIGGISIEQAKISWDDQQQGKYIEINDLDFITDKLVFGKPIALDLSFSMVNKALALTEVINLSTDLIITEAMDSFKFIKIDIESETTGKDIPGGKVLATLFANVAIDRVQQTLDISDLELKVDNLTLTASIKGRQIIDAPEFNGAIQVAEFNLATLLANMAMPLPEMQDSSVMRKVSTHFSFQASKDTVKINDWFVQLDDTHLQGHGSISHFEKPDINFDLTVDTIDLDRYMAATSSANNAGQADTKAASQHQDMKAVSTAAIAAVAVTTLFPVETLRAINAQGKISIEKLKVNQLNMSGLHFKLNAKNGTISTQQTVKHFYQGSYSGATSIDVHGKTPKITLNHQLRKVQIAPLLKDTLDEAKVTGVVNAAINLKGRGNTEAALKSSLNGHIDFNVKDGVVKGFNLQKIIDQGKALIVGGVLSTTNKNDQTVFSVLKGSAQITNGLVSNEDLYVEASKLRVKGAGTVNLVSEEIDYSINARLLKKPATETEDEKIKGIPITINVGGTFSNPAYSVDMIAMLTAKNKEKINKKKDEWLKKLDKKLGPDVRDLIKGFF